jgi:hypothetical protein
MENYVLFQLTVKDSKSGILTRWVSRNHELRQVQALPIPYEFGDGESFVITTRTESKKEGDDVLGVYIGTDYSNVKCVYPFPEDGSDCGSVGFQQMDGEEALIQQVLVRPLPDRASACKPGERIK